MIDLIDNTYQWTLSYECPNVHHSLEQPFFFFFFHTPLEGTVGMQVGTVDIEGTEAAEDTLAVVLAFGIAAVLHRDFQSCLAGWLPILMDIF